MGTTNRGIQYPDGTSTISANDFQTLASGVDTVVSTTNKLTSKGDIPAYSGTAITRIPVGSNGQALTSSTATPGLQWKSYTTSTPAMVPIFAGTVGTATSSYSITSIPGTFSNLMLQYKVAAISGSHVVLRMQFNSATAGSYTNYIPAIFGASTLSRSNTAAFTGGTANIILGYIPGTSGGPFVDSAYAFGSAYIPAYAATTIGGTAQKKSVFGAHYMPAPSYTFSTFYAGTWGYVGGSVSASSTRRHVRINEEWQNQISSSTFSAAEGVIDNALGTNIYVPSQGFNQMSNVYRSVGTASTRTTTNGTVILSLEPGVTSNIFASGDTVIVSGYAGTATGINGTWTLSAAGSNPTIRYRSDNPGTITAGTSVNQLDNLTVVSLKTAFFTLQGSSNSSTAQNFTVSTAVTIYPGVGNPSGGTAWPANLTYTHAISQFAGTAISSIQINTSASSIAVGSVFELYGIKE